MEEITLLLRERVSATSEREPVGATPEWRISLSNPVQVNSEKWRSGGALGSKGLERDL